MAESVTLLALSQMIDISINREENVINFHALHALLHVMVQQLSLTDVAVEFRGEESEKVQHLIKTIKPGAKTVRPTYSVSAATPIPKQKKKGTQKKKASLQDVIQEKERQRIEEKREKELRVIERRKDSKEDPDLNPLPLKSPTGSLLGITPGDLQTVVIIESQSNLPHYSIAITKATFDNLQNDLETCKLQIKELTELPANMGLIEATKRDSGPVLEMFQVLNLTKRMDANEASLAKIGSLLEDFVKSDRSVAPDDAMNKIQEVRASIDPAPRSRGSSDTVKQIEIRVINLERAVKDLSENIGTFTTSEPRRSSVTEASFVPSEMPEPQLSESKPEERPSVSIQESPGKEPRTSSVRSGSVATPTTPASKKSTPRSSTDPSKVFAPQTAFESHITEIDLTDLSPNEALMLMQEEFKNLKKWLTENIQEVNKLRGLGPGSEIDSQLIEHKFNQCTKRVDELNQLYNKQIGLLNEQFNKVQNEMNDVATKLEVVLPGGDSTGINAETTMELANKLELFEKELIAITEKAEQMQQEKELQDKQTESMMEQIDLLKIIKANREDLEDALGDKADACMINRKVSHDQFDAACDDLSRGIEEALTKLEQQADMWRQALDSIQKEVGNKLDKMEVDPLREFVNTKLKALQEKFKALTGLKKEQEAAGTKSRFLRNVNCISCDKDVVMRKEMDVSLKPKAYAMPPTRNMAPYLAYELDQLRKQQKCVPNSKNLNFIESAIKTRAKKDKNHLCNRYCGGSHTTTTPQQRVTRLGHFLEQWGPEIAPLQDEYIRGNDNHMYKARDEALLNKKISNVESGARSASIRPSTAGSPIVEHEEPQQDRNTFVSGEAQEIIANQATKSSNKKSSNIGAINIEVHRDSQQSGTGPPPERASQSYQPEQQRVSQSAGDRQSQSAAFEKKTSVAPEVPGKTQSSQSATIPKKASVAPELGKTQSSQSATIPKKASVAPEPGKTQSSQSATIPKKASVAPEPGKTQSSQSANIPKKASVAPEPGKTQSSQSANMPKKMSAVEEAPGESRSSQSANIPKKTSVAPETPGKTQSSQSANIPKKMSAVEETQRESPSTDVEKKASLTEGQE